MTEGRKRSCKSRVSELHIGSTNIVPYIVILIDFKSLSSIFYILSRVMIPRVDRKIFDQEWNNAKLFARGLFLALKVFFHRQAKRSSVIRGPDVAT